jgi:hypothetical protein
MASILAARIAGTTQGDHRRHDQRDGHTRKTQQVVRCHAEKERA